MILNDYLSISEGATPGNTEGTIAVDLDGTLAHYDRFRGYNNIGKPIPKMMNRVKKWIDQGRNIIIFTARANHKPAIKYVKKWLEDNGLPGLPVTNIKSQDIVEFWDDRAIQIRKNTGERADGN